MENKEGFGLIPPQLDLSDIDGPGFDGALVEDSVLEDHYPIGFTPGEIEPIEFFIRGNELWVELLKSYFFFEGEILGTVPTEKKSGSATELKTAKEDTSFDLVQNFWHSVFTSIDVSINDTSVSFHNANYPFIAYIQNLMNLSFDQKKTSGILFGWEKTKLQDKK